jgi:hypothetical protein
MPYEILRLPPAYRASSAERVALTPPRTSGVPSENVTVPEISAPGVSSTTSSPSAGTAISVSAEMNPSFCTRTNCFPAATPSSVNRPSAPATAATTSHRDGLAHRENSSERCFGPRTTSAPAIGSRVPATTARPATRTPAPSRISAVNEPSAWRVAAMVDVRNPSAPARTTTPSLANTATSKVPPVSTGCGVVIPHHGSWSPGGFIAVWTHAPGRSPDAAVTRPRRRGYGFRRISAPLIDPVAGIAACRLPQPTPANCALT